MNVLGVSLGRVADWLKPQVTSDQSVSAATINTGDDGSLPPSTSSTTSTELSRSKTAR